MGIKIVILLILIASTNEFSAQFEHYNYDSMNLVMSQKTILSMLREYADYVDSKSKTYKKYEKSIASQYNSVRKELAKFRNVSIACLRPDINSRDMSDCIRSKGTGLVEAVDSFSRIIMKAADEYDAEKFCCTCKWDTTSRTLPYFEDTGSEIITEMSSVSFKYEKSTNEDVARIKIAYLDQRTLLPRFNAALRLRNIWK